MQMPRMQSLIKLVTLVLERPLLEGLGCTTHPGPEW